jgi:3-phosphoshikimate 1-carboxyvinyltransferase
MATQRIDPHPGLLGELRVPGDKSISHRSLLLAALSEGASTIVGLSQGEDVHRTRALIEALGATVTVFADGVEVKGGRARLHASATRLDCGNSGTTMRLAAGVLAGIEGHHELVGDASLSRRPMDRVAQPLRSMGAAIRGQGERELPPVLLEGRPLRGIRYELPVPSAQVKSALLLAGLHADGPTTVVEAIATRPNTEEMLAQAGATISIRRTGAAREITVEPSMLAPQAWSVPGDPSQAAFFVVAGLLASEGDVTVRGLYGDETRTGYLDVLGRMGATLERSVGRDGTLQVTARSSRLSATTIHGAEIPSLDEVPILVVAACAASGTTIFHEVAELRIKESDRFEASLALARGLGVRATGQGDDLVIEGLGTARAFGELTLHAAGDHRLAMAAAVAGVTGAGAIVADFDAVATSYPGFLEQLAALS